MFKTKNNLGPETLTDLMPEVTGRRTGYQLRSNNHISLMKSRTKVFDDSFLPATIMAWNSLPDDQKNARSVEQFKDNTKPEKCLVPEFIYEGNRKGQIPQTRMRLRHSDLNEDLFLVNLAETPVCRCNNSIEDASLF